jgi:DNA mismatch repair protein MutS2
VNHALRVLEFPAILEHLQRLCETPIAAESTANLAPTMIHQEVETLIEETRQGHDLIAKHSVPPMGTVRDWRQSIKRMGKGGSGSGEEIFGIAEAMATMRSIKTLLSPIRSNYLRLWELADAAPEHPRLEQTIFDSLDGNGEVKDAASQTLTSIRQKKRSTTSRILEAIQAYTSGSRRDLLSDPIYTVRDGRYVIPLKAENRGKIKGIVHDTSGSGQTIYLEPEDVLQLGNSLRELESAEREEVQRILMGLASKIGGIAAELCEATERLSELDLILAKARLAFEMKGSPPQVGDLHSIQIQGGRHPLLDSKLAVPLDLQLGSRFGSILITGPNTGGKTVAIKTVGLFVCMLQSGLFVPAIDVRFGPFTQIWADIGDEQSLQQSLSTFSGHIKNIAEALKVLRSGALVLLDEVGAGTDPAEGAALAKAVLAEMAAKGATILASTHYGELKAFAYSTDGFTNAAMEFDSKTLRPTYRLLLGAPGASHALKIAERYGIPPGVIERAKEGLGEQHQDLAAMLERLELAQKQARIAQGDADRRLGDLRKREDQAAKKLAEAEEIRKRASANAQSLIEEALRQIRLEAADIFEELKQAGADQKGIDRARIRLKDLQEVGQEFADEYAHVAPTAKKGEVEVQWKVGDTAKVDGYNQTGFLLTEPKGQKVQIQIGPLKMTVPTSQLTRVHEVAVKKPRANIGLQRAQTATTEIHLRAMRAEDALEELEKFLDDAVLAGLPSVRIVHGKGEGILRQLTRQTLQRNRHVKGYREGEPAEGGAGVTIATFK